SNNSKIKGERTLTFEITKIRIDVMNASLPDADYYGFYPDGSPLDAQTHLFNIIATGSDEFLPQGSKTVEVAVKEYDGTPWELRQWVAGQNVFGLPDGFTFSGILRTRHADAGYYWEDAGVTQSQFIGIPDGLKNIHIDNPSLWTNIEHISDFIWASNPVIRNTRGEDVSRNFEVLVTGAVSINPFEINSDNLKWPGVFNGTYYEYEYTGREIVPVPTVTNKDGVVLNPQFRVKITSAFSDPDVAIDPSDTLYSAKIMGCDTRNFIFVTYNHSPNKNFNYIDFKVVKAKLRIDMSVPNYLIGANELEFSFDFSNWAAYQQQYNIHITGLGYNSVLGGTIHTTSATEWAGWKNVRYSSNGPEYFVEWSGTSPFKVTNPTHTPEDITDFYEVTLNATVKIEWNRFDFNYTITDPTLPAPYVIKGVDRGMGIEMYEATADTVNIRYGVDGYEHIFDVQCNNVGVSAIPGVEGFVKTFSYTDESGTMGTYSNYAIKEVGVIKALTMNMSRDRFYPVSQTIYITTVKGSYVVSDLTKEYDRLAVD
ncbi:MAG: hypothetical protein K2G50_02905, partial [Anaeroplasmataceae bacterium]|nr:hypothetical protein [Anaeroplasmataceae bacterium]